MHPDLYVLISRDRERELEQRLRYRLAAQERSGALVRPRRPRRALTLTALVARLAQPSRAVSECSAPVASCATT